MLEEKESNNVVETVEEDPRKRAHGRAPSSRLANSRAMKGRDISTLTRYLDNALSTDQYNLETYIAPSEIPEGYEVLWVREIINGRPDSTNLRRVEEQLLYFRAPASWFPSRAYKGSNGEMHGDDDCIRVGDSVLYVREKELGERQRRKQQVEADRFRSFSQHMNMDPKLHPFVKQGVATGTHDYASSKLSAGFLNSFGD